ncbi:LysR family transcriptional regulator, transcription activator of glutamate synthase operon [Alteribacillus persepolensis]|uniref:LysR family transcriptional regulator, transcription activator of glutamate synthase operon n=1 Tax=Alteribacillus persepolensis TaxID=568899 RepID=A0A1G8FUA7_9BACI|nr:LysR family transcriptional regulator [Alteribacillus persepolensis]SDH85723.1 LysR family transcriptional regulator, transcription activator of glutamate synthase operon [Alteribacillus persepolensis]
MELRQLKYFMEVAKREHMTEAADNLHVAQSAVSRQIYNLEAELGVDLFVRQGRRVRLTPIGRMFLESSQQALKMLESAKREVKEHLDPTRGTIRITYPISMAAYTLPTAISSFREEYPDARFQLKQNIYFDVIDEVANGEFNIGLLAPVPEDDKNIKGYTLFTENVIALLPQNHKYANKKSLRLTDLADEPFIVLPEGAYFRELVIDECKKQGFTPEIAFEGDDVDALKGLVSAGLGVALIPEVTLVDTTPRFTVKKMIENPEVTRTIGVITPQERQLLPTERLFFEFLQSFFSNMGGY